MGGRPHFPLVRSALVVATALASGAAIALACTGTDPDFAATPVDDGGEGGSAVDAPSSSDVAIDNATDAPCSADLGHDPANCGRCGHDCLGGGCDAGGCEPVVLVAEDGGATI